MRKLVIIPFLLIAIHAYGQVKDLPIAFSKKGYVIAIDFDQKMIQIDFFTSDKNLGVGEELKSQVLSLANCEIINAKKEKIMLNDLRSSDEVLVNGQWFQEKDEYIIQKITVQSKPNVGDLAGRIDLIKGDFAYIDGHKVKLAQGKKIIGDSKTGYKGQSFNSFGEIKHGVYASVGGKYDDGGYFLARNFTIAPDVETSYDKSALTADQAVYDKIYTNWLDPSKRKSLLGKNVEGIGQITNNDVIQEYVNRVGQKVIPDYIKEANKIDFIFIVVDNPDLLAYVKPNGVAIVYTGLLYNLENEAQLAIILGHEITHVIYKHQAYADNMTARKEQNKDLVNKTINVGTTGYNTVKDILNGRKNNNQSTDDQKQKKIKQDQAELNELVKETVSDILDKNATKYSIEQENQSDRVGLFLATLAGYDPKEAPVIWKNLYGRYGKLTTEKGASLEKQLATIQDLQNKKNKEYDTRGLVNQAVSTVLTIKKNDYTPKIIKTHPEEIKRYQALNNLIALYWNDPKLLEGTTNKEDEYRRMINKLAQSKSPPLENKMEKAVEKPKAEPKAKPKKKQ